MFYTDRLLLRPVDVEADCKTFTRWLNDPEMMRSVSLDPPRLMARDWVKEWIQTGLKAAQESNMPWFAVCLKPKDEDLPERLDATADFAVRANGEPRYPMIGLFNLRSRMPGFTHRIAHFGIAFDEEYTGKGYGSELLKWAQQYVFETLGMHRFELDVAEDNPRAIRCYENAGFVKEGVKRKFFWFKGKWLDSIEMGMLEEEWREQRAKQA